MATKEDLIGAFDEAYHSLWLAADIAVTRGHTAEAAGGWGVRAVLAHVAAWESEATARLPLVQAGAPSIAYDEDAFNAAAVEAIGGEGLARVRERLEDAHARLMTLLDRLDGSAFVPGAPAHEWVTSLTAHSMEHAHQMGGETLSPPHYAELS